MACAEWRAFGAWGCPNRGFQVLLVGNVLTNNTLAILLEQLTGGYGTFAIGGGGGFISHFLRSMPPSHTPCFALSPTVMSC